MTESTAPPLPQHLHAIVLDTNAMPKGRFAKKSLTELTSVLGRQELDVDVWVPEPAIWEWAEHIHSDLSLAREGYSRALRTASDAGLAVEQARVEHQGVVDVLQDLDDLISKMAGVRVLRVEEHAAAAVAGLRDQVLQVGVGRRKTGKGGGVKTGASDSAMFNLIQAVAGDAISRVVLVSGDQDARTFFEEVSDAKETKYRRPVIVPSIWAAKKGLLALLPGPAAEEAAIKQIEESLRRGLVERPELLHAASLETHGIRMANPWEGGEFLDTSVTPTEVTEIARIRDVEVATAAGYATAEADVELTVELGAVWYDGVADRLEHEWDERSGVTATLQVSLETDGDDWTLTVDHIVVG